MQKTQFKYLLIALLLSLNVLGAGTYIKGPALIEGFTTTASAAGTLTLTVASETKQIITGVTTHTVVMPDATTLVLGRKFLIINKSTGLVTVNASGGGLLGTIAGGAQAELHLRAAGSAAGTWDLLSSSSGGGGVWGTITGTLSDQTDLNTALGLKAPLASPTFTGTITTPLTASRALVTGASSELAASSVTATQLGYLGTATSDLQVQLNAKQARSTLTTKGDLYVATASATVARQGVGSDGTFLKADSTQTNGVIWASVTGSALAVTSKTTTYTATTSDDVILVYTGSAWTLTLYAASGNSGKVLRVVKTSSDTNSLTIDGNASETINGFANIKLNYQFDEVTLVCDGTNWNIISQMKAPVITKYLSSSGTHTLQNGVKYLKVKMVGGGGGGGGAGTANSGNTGGTGGNTTFGTSLLAANGGTGGNGFTGGAGGSVSLGTGPVGIALGGGDGTFGFFGQTINYTRGSAGASSPFGGGGRAGSTTGGAAGSNTGAGGGGGSMDSATDGYAGGGGGAGGYIGAIIYNTSATYGYSVGSGGGGGAAGTTGNAGGAGGSGQIFIEEHFQ